MSSLALPGPTAVLHAVELDVDLPASGSVASALPHGARPRGALSQLPVVKAATETVRYSDLGYVTDAHVPYPPLVADAFGIDRRLDLAPGGTPSQETWGQITFNSPGNAFGPLVTSRVNDHLPVRVLAGRKRIDPVRGLLLDPAYADLVPMFTGLGSAWQPDRNSLTVALQDVSYWLDSAMPVAVFGGSGRLDGDTGLAGRNKPRVRGAVLNITPVLIDAANAVYQLSDGPVSGVTLYEGGYAGGYVSDGTVSDVYASQPAAGHYTIQSGSGGSYLRRGGGKAVYAITCDVTGSFPSGAAPADLLTILRQMLLEDMAIPPAYLDAGWSGSGVAGMGWAGGWFWDGSASVTGRDVVATMLSGLGVRLMAGRAGTLRPLAVVLPAASAAKMALTPTQVIDLAAVALDDGLVPPPYRWRVGYQHVFTVQEAGSGLSPQVTSNRQGVIVQADRWASWFSAAVRSRYRQPTDPDAITTALTNQSDAAAIAAAHGAIWSTAGAPRRIWAAKLPKPIGYRLDIGDAVTLTFPAPGLASPLPGLVIGEQVRGSDSTTTLQILV